MRRQAILVVDPNPTTARRVAEAFADLPYEVVVARDGAAAMAELSIGLPSMALIAASLPGGNGYDLAQNLHVEDPDLAIVLMTGGYEVYQRGRAADAGVLAHLSKPFSAEDLRALADTHLHGPVEGFDPEPVLPDLPLPAAPPVAPTPAPIPGSGDRIATILPRDYADVPLVAVDPEVVAPALERAVLEVLPEVVEAVIRQSLVGSNAFRDLVQAAVEEAVADKLPGIASRLVEARLAEIESGAE